MHLKRDGGHNGRNVLIVATKMAALIQELQNVKILQLNLLFPYLFFILPFNMKGRNTVN